MNRSRSDLTGDLQFGSGRPAERQAIDPSRRSASMCGIVGHVGNHRSSDFLLEGLRRLEYRGYDSAGIATLSIDGGFNVVKSVGRIEVLAERLAECPLPGS